MDRQAGAAAAVMQTLYLSIMVNRELSVPTLTYGHELWVVTKRMGLQI